MAVVFCQSAIKDILMLLQIKRVICNTYRFIFLDLAFLNDAQYFKALCVCLKAIELNQISWLAELDLKLVY